ncbi:hypothetical protein K435DRAFT_641439 [Dendrothele bispora CBS 962.96]|uniref:Derlin n=1 Tax=Dendrothele bispora (strain CBS 962.96) TaxID=1314807 RepID=A0A4S8MXK8_DENBC|nr:hypothetical protein K435DRAFT_641439 [Dendrothele bispora CBS 962.96]
MSFEYAPFTKGVMVVLALTSIVVGIFDVKHYFHLQLVPHISRHHQYWRLLAHNVAFSNSSDLFIAEILFYNAAVQVERHFGTHKFASFVFVSTFVSILSEFLSLILFHRAGLNYIPAGPFGLIFSILYQYSRIIPSVYDFRIFGVPLNNKSFTYFLAMQLTVSYMPGSVAVAIVGVLTGQIYRSDLVSLKSYRIGPKISGFSKRFLLPLVGSTRGPRRSNRAIPEPVSDTRLSSLQNDEVVTTARTSTNATSRLRDTVGARPEAGTSVVREWVHELTGRPDGTTAGMRVPPEAEINQLTVMFPDISREAIVGALQRRYSLTVFAMVLHADKWTFDT